MTKKTDGVWFILLWAALLLLTALLALGLGGEVEYDPLAMEKAQATTDIGVLAKVAQTADLAASWGIPYTLAHEIEAAAVTEDIPVPVAFALVAVEQL